MILVMDVGNTNIKMGLFDEKKLVDSWRLSTIVNKTADEYGIALANMLSNKGYRFDMIKGIIISSVIPSLNYTLEHMCWYYIGIKPLLVGPGVKTGLNIKYDDAKEVGSDRIVNCVGAFNIYGGPCIVIDFGTATTFNAVNRSGEFLGGVICAGINMCRDGLVNGAAKLPSVEVKKPKTVIGKTTIANMQSGLVYGFVGMVEYLVERIKEELNEKTVTVIATGGYSSLISGETKIINYIDKTLTLEGLRIVYSLN